MNLILLLFFLFFFMMFIGVPIGISIALSCAAVLVAAGGTIPMSIIPQRMYTASNSFTLLAIPLFMMVGTIMEKSGIPQRLVDFANAIVGWMKCGMCYVAVISGILMGGISGSCSADTAALSSVMTPTMKKMGYEEGFTSALMADCGTIGIIIPPSIPMIIMAGVSGVSVGTLFVGGIIPGILVGLAFMIASRIVCGVKKMGVTELQPFSYRYLLTATRRAILALFAPIIIMGGILGGIFTATESGCVAVVYTFIVGLFIYKTIKPSMIKEIMVESAKSTGTIMLVVSASFAMSWLLTRFNFPNLLSGLLSSFSENLTVIMIIINAFYLIGGMFIDNGALIILLTPIMMPVAMKSGIDPVFFAIMISVNIAIGSITPPVGSALYIGALAGKVSLEVISKACIPFIIAMAAVLIIIYLFPAAMLYLPRILVG